MNRAVLTTAWLLSVVLLSTASQPAPRAEPPASSEDYTILYGPPYIGLAVKLGTLGPGLDLTVGLTDWFNLRAGGNYAPIRFSGTVQDVEYDVDAQLGSVPLLVDLHPFRNEFRITGGVLYNRNRADLDSRPAEEVRIGDHRYPPELIGELNGSIRFREWCPYLGLGFGNAVLDADKTWGFVFDLGVMIQGSPDVGLDSSGPLARHPVFQADLEKERQDIQEDADSFRVYPVLAFGISYQF